ncbi:hypothetical protein [Micromonospora luteifusca]|uniref:hypothetical protein n=1 Tax=Micromonospora luteifusca TaxID=709860 RepID=UPI0033AA2925
MPDPVTDAALLRPILGRRLLAVTEARYWFDDKPVMGTDGLLHFWMHFEGAPAIMAHGCGELLKLTEEKLYSSYDMQEHGSGCRRAPVALRSDRAAGREPGGRMGLPTRADPGRTPPVPVAYQLAEQPCAHRRRAVTSDAGAFRGRGLVMD